MDCDVEVGSGVSSSSGSESDDGSEEGRQGDDEQSDWFFESSANVAGSSRSASSPAPNGGRGDALEPSCMGIPLIRSRASLGRHSPAPGAPIPESSDTDVSQSSWPSHIAFATSPPALPRHHGLPRHHLSPGAAIALNKRLQLFLANATQTQLRISQLRKGERKEILRLAAFYRLDVRGEKNRRRTSLLLTKTGFNTFLAVNFPLVTVNGQSFQRNCYSGCSQMKLQLWYCDTNSTFVSLVGFSIFLACSYCADINFQFVNSLWLSFVRATNSVWAQLKMWVLMPL